VDWEALNGIGMWKQLKSGNNFEKNKEVDWEALK
jgi:hypothetical protein